MVDEAARYVYSLVSRLAKLGRRQLSGDELFADPAMMGILFRPDADGHPRRIRMTDLSRSLMVSKPAATQVINRLAESGFVERIRDDADRRVVYIQATDQGLAYFEKQLNERVALINRAIDKVGMEKARQLGIMLDEFVDALVSLSEV